MSYLEHSVRAIRQKILYVNRTPFYLLFYLFTGCKKPEWLTFILLQQLSQIVRVLNSHLAQLQWIDANSLALHAKVAAAQKASGNTGSHNYGGSENDASESFYRSYLGRR